MLHAHGFGLAEVLITFGHVQTKEPSLLGRKAFGSIFYFLVVEKDDIGVDARVRREDGARQTDNGVYVELAQQLLFNGHFGIVGAKEETVWQDNSSSSVFLEAVHNEHHKEVGGLA